MKYIVIGPSVIDENSNMATIDRHANIDAAIKSLETCTDCYGCVDCTYCQSCKHCILCIRCKQCNSCSYCIEGNDCSKCVNCYKCQACNRCSYSEHSKNCNDCQFITTITEQPMINTRLEDWMVTVTRDSLIIGCQKHVHEHWKNLSDTEIHSMDRCKALKFWTKYKTLLLGFCDVAANSTNPNT